MASKVIQGSFIGGRPRAPASAPMPRPPGPPAPAFAARLNLAQAHGAAESFQVDPAQLGLANGGGRPLPDAVRGKMEAALGADFSGVRVHVGPQAERIGAIAFTTGADIYFAPGRFQPDTTQGQQLLGHELAHVVQQRAGRVRAPQWGGVAVVQDRLLEAEAERLGVRAALHPAPAQPRMAGVHAQPRMAGVHAHRTARDARGIQGAAAGAKPALLQRTIFKWDDADQEWNVEQPGTPGAFTKPVDGRKGRYFNDINGKSSNKIDKVRAGLTDLMMVTGSLNDLSKNKPIFWPDKLWKKLIALPQDLNHLGRITLTGAGNYTVQPYAGSNQALVPKNAGDLLARIWTNVLQPFMHLNGQLAYIRGQKWFRQQKADVMIEVNFYKNRGYGARLQFHKDTEGDNLFVNLLFNNQNPIPATEWLEDLAPSPAKLADMKTLMPRKMRKAIADTRSKIAKGKHRLAEQGIVRGGIAPEASFVSWADELVWHATPSIESRLVRKILESALTNGATALHDVPLASALKALKSIPGTQIEQDFNAWARKNPKKKEDAFYTYYIGADLGGPKKKRLHKKDVAAHFNEPELFAYEHHSPESGVETDDPFFGTPSSRSDVATGIRFDKARRNSTTLIDLTDVDLAPRSFLRTWVRVVRRNVAYGTPSIDVQPVSGRGKYTI